MKFTDLRTFSRPLLSIISCCVAIVCALAGSATPDRPSAAISHGRTSLLTWIQLSPANSPPARTYLAMTYDPVSGKIIMFGGYDGNTYLNDTWEFDGATWTEVTTNTPPPPRTAAQMAYDSVSQKVVLYGGFDGNNYLGDTWLWDGATSQWTHATPAHQPPAVTGPMLFPDPNGRVDYFGGFAGQFYQLEMWQWNGADWMQLFPSTVPFARANAAVATNTSTGQVVLFGGLADVNPNNTWTYDGTTWTEQSPAVQPLLVYGASAAFDAGFQQVVLFGGASGGEEQNTTWVWDQAGGTWMLLSTQQSPPAREGAGMAYDIALGRVVLFGGQDNNGYFNDTWALISAATPTPTPTATVTATFTPTPTPTGTITPTATPSATPARSVTPRPRPTPYPRPTP